MDKTGDGVITIADLRGTYSARKHPQVISGEKTEDEVLSEFLRNFDVIDQDGSTLLLLRFHFWRVLTYVRLCVHSCHAARV